MKNNSKKSILKTVNKLKYLQQCKPKETQKAFWKRLGIEVAFLPNPKCEVN